MLVVMPEEWGPYYHLLQWQHHCYGSRARSVVHSVSLLNTDTASTDSDYPRYQTVLFTSLCLNIPAYLWRLLLLCFHLQKYIKCQGNNDESK